MEISRKKKSKPLCSFMWKKAAVYYLNPYPICILRKLPKKLYSMYTYIYKNVYENSGMDCYMRKFI